MSKLPERMRNSLAVIPVIWMTTIIDTGISSFISISTFLHLVTISGYSKGLSLFIAILLAIAVYIYIVCQPNIRNYIKSRSE